MKVIILAAGQGSRLRPLTEHQPKAMVQVNGASLIERQLRIIDNIGIDDVLIVGGHCAEKLSIYNRKVVVNHQYRHTNMVHSLLMSITDVSEDIIVTYGDTVHSPSIFDHLLKENGDIVVPVDMDWLDYWQSRFDNPLTDAESLSFDSNDHIINIGNKASNVSEIQAQYMGIIKFSPTSISALKQHCQQVQATLNGTKVSQSYLTDALMELITLGHPITGLRCKGEPWVEIDTIDDFENEITIKRLQLIDQAIKRMHSH